MECQTLHEHKHRKFFHVGLQSVQPGIIGPLDEEQEVDPEEMAPQIDWADQRIIQQLDTSDVLDVVEDNNEVHDSMVRIFLHSSGIYNYIQRLRHSNLDTAQILSVIPEAADYILLAAYVSAWLEDSMNATLGATQYLRRLCTSESE